MDPCSSKQANHQVIAQKDACIYYNKNLIIVLKYFYIKFFIDF